MNWIAIRQPITLGLLAICLSGCGRGDGPELAEVVGVVTYKGKPVAGATVVFIPTSGPTAHGTTDADGRFAWMTRDENGAVVGDGRVAITALPAYQFKSEEELTAAEFNKIGRSLIPVKYGRPETSGLTVSVKSREKNEFKFNLTE